MLPLLQSPLAHNLQMGEMLWYVLPFYILTFAALSFFLHKLIRPRASMLPLYIFALIGTLWAGLVTYQFRQIQDTQLGGADLNAALKDEKLTDRMRAQLLDQQKEQSSLWFGNFYIIATPNIALLFLGIVVDWQQRRKQ